MTKLDEGKLRQFFTNQGLSTKRSDDLAKKLAKEEDLDFVEVQEVVRSQRGRTTTILKDT